MDYIKYLLGIISSIRRLHGFEPYEIRDMDFVARDYSKSRNSLSLNPGSLIIFLRSHRGTSPGCMGTVVTISPVTGIGIVAMASLLVCDDKSFLPKCPINVACRARRQPRHTFDGTSTTRPMGAGEVESSSGIGFPLVRSAS